MKINNKMCDSRQSENVLISFVLLGVAYFDKQSKLKIQKFSVNFLSIHTNLFRVLVFAFSCCNRKFYLFPPTLSTARPAINANDDDIIYFNRQHRLPHENIYHFYQFRAAAGSLVRYHFVRFAIGVL